MAFDWLESDVPAALRTQGAAKFKAQQEDEVRVRAGLLRRLGYSKSYAESRCLRNLAWAFEGAGKAPLTQAEVKALVAAAFKGS